MLLTNRLIPCRIRGNEGPCIPAGSTLLQNDPDEAWEYREFALYQGKEPISP